MISMKLTSILVCFAALITGICFAGDAKVDNHHYTHAISYKAGDGENTTWLQLLRLGEDCNLTNRSIKFSAPKDVAFGAFEELWKGFDSIKDFQKHELDDFVEGLDLTNVHYVVTFQRANATGRHEKTRQFAIPLEGRSEEFLQWLTKLKKLNGEQAGAGQPATALQLKSEGKEKPQPESERRSR